MESHTFLLALILIIVPFASAIKISEDPTDDRRTNYKCLENSVVVEFQQKAPFEVTFSTLYASEDDEDSGCSRTFSQHEPAVKELKFKPCGLGSRKFRVYIEEKYKDLVIEHRVNIECPDYYSPYQTVKRWFDRLFF
ncbi:uncharacterized protein LOC103575723 [Microplitis demolitor]|uniref:uncharacterized protein LOC103575723 n=1 Tax=Microplitis demolitor TaxID=69319 RepID=UPI0004CCBEF1|nr:uncharacterized protein LOC103575723 [Microplitis demolitor]